MPSSTASYSEKEVKAKEKYATAWKRSFANELGRLAQGVAKWEKGTNTIFFIPYEEVPEDRRKDVTYRRIICDYRPQKKEKERTRLTVGGNLNNYPDDVSMPTADTITAKLHINSTISTIGTRYICANIKNFYLDTPMERKEYTKLPIELIPEEIIAQYNLKEKQERDGCILE
eukprot:3994206-Ditylum_brightwellii.AAC.1